MANNLLLCNISLRRFWRLFILPFLGACLLFFFLWAGFSDAILDVVEVFAIGAILSRIINHCTAHQGKGFLTLSKLPIKLLLHAIGILWVIGTLSSSAILPFAWFLGTYDDLLDLIGYCFRD